MSKTTKKNALLPNDFMFELSKEELTNWRSQFATSNPNLQMGLRYKPYAFTEQGVSMLSSVLRSPRAIVVNIEIMRAFIRMRHLLTSQKELTKIVMEMREFMLKNSQQTNQKIRHIWEAIEKLANPPQKPSCIGFKLN